jgi:hypothetical protein
MSNARVLFDLGVFLQLWSMIRLDDWAIRGCATAADTSVSDQRDGLTTKGREEGAKETSCRAQTQPKIVRLCAVKAAFSFVLRGYVDSKVHRLAFFSW